MGGTLCFFIEQSGPHMCGPEVHSGRMPAGKLRAGNDYTAP